MVRGRWRTAASWLALVLAAGPGAAQAPGPSLSDQVDRGARSVEARVIQWRRNIHAHPELQFDTDRTSALVEEKLRAFGCDEVVTGIGRSGVVGVIRGRSTASGRAVGLRVGQSQDAG